MSKLVPTAAFNATIIDRISTDGAFLAYDSLVAVWISSNFTPSPNLQLSDVELLVLDGLWDSPVLPTNNALILRDRESGALGLGLNTGNNGLRLRLNDTLETEILLYGFAIVIDGDRILASCKFAEPKSMRYLGDYIEPSTVFGFLPVQPFNVD